MSCDIEEDGNEEGGNEEVGNKEGELRRRVKMRRDAKLVTSKLVMKGLRRRV